MCEAETPLLNVSCHPEVVWHDRDLAAVADNLDGT